LVALGNVVFNTIVTVFVFGLMMAASVAEVINAFQIKTWGKFLLWLLRGGTPSRGGNEVRSLLSKKNRLPPAGFILLSAPRSAPA